MSKNKNISGGWKFSLIKLISHVISSKSFFVWNPNQAFLYVLSFIYVFIFTEKLSETIG